jgi:hypothetical protein
VPALSDAARFLADDPDELVAAAFACPVCLHRPDRMFLGDADEEGALARCACHPCQREWDVALDPWQALRVQLTPPH